MTAAGVTLSHEDWEGTLRFAGAFAAQGLTVLTLKNTIYENRPDNVGHDSFPSGHAAVTFASAEFLRERYGWTYGAPAYALAAFTGYSRVESEHHYWHDVGAGAGIGILSSWLFTHQGGRRRAAQRSKMILLPDQRGTGMPRALTPERLVLLVGLLLAARVRS